ncbi:MAG: hypothetical protein Q7J85_03945 [Bacillota bacterium]|nr:hypothetical protein [Bacillota bacterium]
MALDESVKEDDDRLYETDGLTIIYEKKIAPHLNDRIIEFHSGPQGGFSIQKEGSDSGCGGTCC